MIAKFLSPGRRSGFAQRTLADQHFVCGPE
jgi:hypothetical protein